MYHIVSNEEVKNSYIPVWVQTNDFNRKLHPCNQRRNLNKNWKQKSEYQWALYSALTPICCKYINVENTKNIDIYSNLEPNLK